MRRAPSDASYAAFPMPTTCEPCPGNTNAMVIAGTGYPPAAGTLGLFDLYFGLYSVQLAAPGVAATREALLDGDRERLALDQAPELLDRLRDGPRVAQADPVGDLEPGLLAQVVQLVDELARETFLLEVRRERGLERGDRSGVAADRVTGRADVLDEHLGGQEREAFDLERAVGLLSEPPLGERRAHPREILAELRSERLELRFHAQLDEPGGIVADLELFHVQLVTHEPRDLAARIERAAVPIGLVEDDDEPPQRRTDLHASLAPRGAAERHDAHRRPHLAVERLVDRLGTERRIVREMHRRRRRRDSAAHEVLVHRLREERHHRSEEPRDRDERLVERLVGGKRVALVARSPEARPRQPDVPGRELVPEGLEPQAGGLQVEAVERLARVTHDARERRQEPPVDDRPLRERHGGRLRVEAVEIRVRHEEGVGVPENEQPPLDVGGRRLPPVDVLLDVLSRVEPADDVGADVLTSLAEVLHVRTGLVELLARSGQHALEGHAHAVRRLAGEHDAHQEL